MVEIGPIIDDLAAESDELDGLVSELTDSAWWTPTPAPGWTVAHQIGHLAWTDEQALIAATAAEQFAANAEALVHAGSRAVDLAAEERSRLPRAEALKQWRDGRIRLAQALRLLPSKQKLPWYGPPMSPASMASARLMETWAHGQDVADALGARRKPTNRLWHIARLGVRTRDFSFRLHGRTPPEAEFRVELTAPDGAIWEFGPASANARVAGGVEDFCLIVTQRRHPDDTDVRAEGEAAREWLGIAQAFAGPPGPGRTAGKLT